MEEIKQAEREVAQYKDQVALGAKLDRLFSDKNFKELILNNFIREGSIRLVSLKGHPDQQEPAKQAAILREMDAIGVLESHFRLIRQQAFMANRSLPEAEALLIELRAEATNV